MKTPRRSSRARTVQADHPRRLLVSVKEAAEMLSVCPRTIYTLIALGRLDLVKIGRATRLKLTDLERYIDKNSKTSGRAGR